MSEPSELPNAIVQAYTVSEAKVPDATGTINNVVVLSLEFLVGAGEYVARQNFMIHPLDAKSIRAMMKNPNEITTTGQEATQ